MCECVGAGKEGGSGSGKLELNQRKTVFINSNIEIIY